jgi:nitrate/TMAO reductase-like tetraheme cytochrome c subunit
MKNQIISCILFTFFLVILFSGCGHFAQNDSIQRYDTIPLTKHWETPIPHQEVPHGLVSLSARDCGECHIEIYKEWKQSTHAIAFQDLQFQSEWKKDNVTVCLNCHTPLQNQQEFIVTGLLNGDYKTPVKTPNPNFDKALQLESITCATCHVRDGNVIGRMGSTNTTHKTVIDSVFLSEKLCISCHNVVDELNPVLICTFETGDEWNNNWAKEEGKNCISCHMPEIERPIMSGMEKRTSHFHNFPGSGIPKFYDMESEELESLEISEGNIDKVYSVGDTIDYLLQVKNSFAGHSVPTGDPERFFLVTFRLKDNEGSLLSEEIHRIGEEWQWYPVAKKILDHNLKPLENRMFGFKYPILTQDMLQLSVEITKHRMTEENAKYNGILGKYPLFIEVFKKNYNIQIE